MQTEDLPNRLIEHCLAGEAWPAQLERTLARLRPGKLLRMLKQLGVRNEVIQPEGLPVLDALVGRSRGGRRRQPKASVTLPRLIYLLRAQWDWVTSNFRGEGKDRLDHVWQVQLCPIALRKRMTRFAGLTFLPSRRRAEFPAGDGFVELKDLNVLTLAFRTTPGGCPGEPVHDTLDVKVFELAADPESGQVTTVPRFSRHFNYAPFPGADRQIVESSDHVVVRGALDLHRAMEWAAVTGSGARDEPEFPRVYLGFHPSEQCDLEVTTDLKIAAWRLLDAYVKAGRPESWEPCPHLAAVRDSLDGRLRPTWADYERKLGPANATHVLLAAVEAHTVERDGLELVPLDFFQLNSPQRPVQSAVRLYARMDGLMRRDRLRGVARYDGLRLIGVDGVVEPVPRLAGVQVMRTPSRDCLAGTTGLVDWDFRKVQPWMAAHFPEPGRPAAEEASCPDVTSEIE